MVLADRNACSQHLLLCLYSAFLGIALLAPRLALAQIITDGSVGPSVSLSGPAMTIGAELGTTHGSNLFHSFQRFDISTDHRATFTGPEQIQNVIGRVTGGSASSIDGTLRSEVGQADLYLINPSGVVLGPNAHVDVPAALHLSTADEVRFSDGARYSASDPGGSTLSMAAPESFGFLAPQPASLEVVGSQLSLRTDQELSLSAGDIAVQDADLRAPGGELRIEAVGASSAQLELATSSSHPAQGSVYLARSQLDTSGDGGGHLLVRAREASLIESLLSADNQGTRAPEGGVELLIDGQLRLSATEVRSHSTGTGDSGGIRVEAATLDIRQGNAVELTGLLSEVEADATGSAGGVTVEIGEAVSLYGAVGIHSSTFGAGGAGPVTITAGSLLLDAQGTRVSHRDVSAIPGIASDTRTEGDAGDITLTIGADMTLRQGSAVSSTTYGAGAAGTVWVRAADIRLDGVEYLDPATMIASTAALDSTGSAGDVMVEVDGLLEVVNSAMIASTTLAQGDAGSVEIRASEMRLDGGGLPEIDTVIASSAGYGSSGQSGNIVLNVDGMLEIRNGAAISSGTFGAGDAGYIEVTAAEARFNGGGLSEQFTGIATNAYIGSNGNAGDLSLFVAGMLDVFNGALITSSTSGDGDAGTLQISAWDLCLDGNGLPGASTAIATSAYSGSSGNAGNLILNVDHQLSMRNGGVIASTTRGQGDAGTVQITTKEMTISGNDATSAGVLSDALPDSRGRAGNVVLTIEDQLTLLGNAHISSSTRSSGDAGTISVDADTITLDGQAAVIASITRGEGDAGEIEVKAAQLSLHGGEDASTGIFSDALLESAGRAGDVNVIAERALSITGEAQISSSTRTTGDAGTVKVQAGEVYLDALGNANTGIFSKARANSSGNAGNVMLHVDGTLMVLDGALISSSTFGEGSAGSVEVSATDARLDGTGQEQFTGIASNANEDSGGNAGDITLNVNARLDILNNAKISSSARATGNAGSVNLHAQHLHIDQAGIYSTADPTASGQVGDITIDADRIELVNQGTISIEALQEAPSDAMLGSKTISIDTGALWLDSGSITAASSSTVPASAILIDADAMSLTRGSRITTESQAANAGPIHISGGSLWLTDSQITTSAEGINGDGGTITLNSDHLILDSGFIQANTAASGARGGDILINNEALIAGERQLSVGASERQRFVPGSGLNIIQAAAPGGEQGDILLTAPSLDLVSGLVMLSTSTGNPDDLIHDPCHRSGGMRASSLAWRGCGGVALDPGKVVDVPLNQDRLDQLLE